MSVLGQASGVAGIGYSKRTCWYAINRLATRAVWVQSKLEQLSGRATRSRSDPSGSSPYSSSYMTETGCPLIVQVTREPRLLIGMSILLWRRSGSQVGGLADWTGNDMLNSPSGMYVYSYWYDGRAIAAMGQWPSAQVQ